MSLEESLVYIEKCDLLPKEKEWLIKKITDFDIDSYDEFSTIITYFNKDGDDILVLDINNETMKIDVLEYHIEIE